MAKVTDIQPEWRESGRRDEREIPTKERTGGFIVTTDDGVKHRISPEVCQSERWTAGNGHIDKEYEFEDDENGNAVKVKPLAHFKRVRIRQRLDAWGKLKKADKVAMLDYLTDEERQGVFRVAATGADRRAFWKKLSPTDRLDVKDSLSPDELSDFKGELSQAFDDLTDEGKEKHADLRKLLK